MYLISYNIKLANVRTGPALRLPSGSNQVERKLGSITALKSDNSSFVFLLDINSTRLCKFLFTNSPLNKTSRTLCCRFRYFP
jgi:hypothetical protein